MPTLPPPPAPPVARHRTVKASIGLVLLLFVVAFGGFCAGGSVEAKVGPPVQVVPGVTIHPEPGWAVAGRGTAGDLQVVQLSSGAGNLDVAVGAFDDGTAAGLLETVRTEILAPQAKQFRMAPEREIVILPSGLQGLRAFYVGVFGDVSQSIEGEVTTFVTSSGLGVVFDGWGAQGSLAGSSDDIHRMIESAELA